jgi:hypothetical protein
MDYDGAVRRIVWLSTGLGLAGAVAATAWWDWRTGAGFLVGAAASTANVLLLRRVVRLLGGEDKPAGTGMLTRFLLLGAAGFAIIKYFEVNLMAALIGLFAAAAAVILEILFELIYAERT